MAGVKCQIDAQGRECSICHAYKPWDEFSPSTPRQPGGHASRCRGCSRVLRTTRYADKNTPEDARRRHLLCHFGITSEQFSWLLDQQGGKCALCLEPETKIQLKTGLLQLLGIDHNHACVYHVPRTGCVHCIRGLLCDHCNLLIGKAEQRAVVAMRFADYLSARPLLIAVERGW